MESELIKTHEDKAEIYRGEAVCNKKIREILESHSLPNGLFPIDIIELGHNKPAGFVWIKQQKKTEKKNPHLNKLMSYDAEITFFIEKGRMKTPTGLKGKEFLVWFGISDIHVEDPSSGKITFSSCTGISRQLPFSAFQIQEDLKNKK